MNAYFSYHHILRAPTGAALACYRLAATLAKRYFPQVTMVTHEKFVHAFKDLPFTQIITDFGDLPQYPLHNLAKLRTIQLAAEKGEPFVHIDGDVFLYKALPLEIQAAGVFAETTQPFVFFDFDIIPFVAQAPEQGPFAQPLATHQAYRCGIVGGHNTTFLHEWATAALTLALHPSNARYFSKFHTAKVWNNTLSKKLTAKNRAPAWLIERYTLWRLAQDRNVKVDLLFPTPYFDQERAKEIGYVHLGGLDKAPKYTKQLLATLQRDVIPKVAQDPEQTPKIEKNIKHYALGAAKAVKAMALPETEQSNARLDICKTCDQWTGTRCKICGCFTKLKVRIPEEKCPLGKW